MGAGPRFQVQIAWRPPRTQQEPPPQKGSSMCTSPQPPEHSTRARTCPALQPLPRSCRKKQKVPGPTSECSKMWGQKPIPRPAGQTSHPGPHILCHRNIAVNVRMYIIQKGPPREASSPPCTHVHNAHAHRGKQVPMHPGQHPPSSSFHPITDEEPSAPRISSLLGPIQQRPTLI